MDENKSIVDDILKDKEERINKDNDNIMKEFPVEVSLSKINQVVGIKEKKQPQQAAQGQPTQQEDAKRKFKLFNKKPKEPRQSIIKMPKPRKPGNNLKIIIPLVLIIAIFVVVFVITFKCDCPEGTDSYAQAKVEATGVLMNSIQNQIILKGYAEIFNGDVVLKLAPYTG